MLKCRICNGPHLTLKCGKENNQDNKVNQDNKDNQDNQNNQDNQDNQDKSKYIKDKYNKDNKRLNNENNNRYKKYFTVKISNLPEDMSDEEMYELLYDWGNIIKLRVLKYANISVAYIDFRYKIEADYFIKALDKTPFEYMILDIMLV